MAPRKRKGKKAQKKKQPAAAAVVPTAVDPTPTAPTPQLVTSPALPSTSQGEASRAKTPPLVIYPSFAPIGKGFLFEERLSSFAQPGWPYRNRRTHKCNPDKMALAGFIWHGVPISMAKCFSCDVEIAVHDFGPKSDPWVVHAEKSPNCDYLQYKELKSHKDLKFKDVYDLFVKKITTSTERRIVETQKRVQAVLLEARRKEDEEEEEETEN